MPRRRLTPADLTPEQLAAAGLERRKQGGPSRLEDRYARHLEALQTAGEVFHFAPQPHPIEIAHRCTYQPDFYVEFEDGGRPPEYVEVKGAKGKRPHYHDDGARVKVKVAARELARRGLRCVVVVVWPQGKRWMREVVKP